MQQNVEPFLDIIWHVNLLDFRLINDHALIILPFLQTWSAQKLFTVASRAGAAHFLKVNVYVWNAEIQEGLGELK